MMRSFPKLPDDKDIKVLKAIVESYVSGKSWGLKKLDDANPTHDIPKEKLTPLIALLQHIDQPKPHLAAWLNFVYILDGIETKEEANKPGNRFFGLAKYFVGNQNTELGKTSRALKAFIISKLNQHSEFDKTINRLKFQQKIIQKAIEQDQQKSATTKSIEEKQAELESLEKKLAALDTSELYTNTFFNEIVKDDPANKTLEENSFNAFISNVINGHREPVLCPKIIAYEAKKATQEAEKQNQGDVNKQETPNLTEAAKTTNTAPIVETKATSSSTAAILTVAPPSIPPSPKPPIAKQENILSTPIQRREKPAISYSAVTNTSAPYKSQAEKKREQQDDKTTRYDLRRPR